ncbi:MAG TPA: GNAT family N-acetyltransferase [Acidobacteriaceae bacterium]|nr:GNAT family N-acetyltransferase [Acidobacteriaceae bacterium]
MTPTLTLLDRSDPAAAQAIHSLLLTFNNETSGYIFDGRAVVITVADPGTNHILGGLWGSTAYGYLHVDMLVLPESLRGRGIGTDLMRKAENEALRRGCHGAYLETFDFQARGFYEKLGYTLFGQLENTPPGHTRYFMSKVLA